MSRRTRKVALCSESSNEFAETMPILKPSDTSFLEKPHPVPAFTDQQKFEGCKERVSTPPPARAIEQPATLKSVFPSQPSPRQDVLRCSHGSVMTAASRAGLSRGAVEAHLNRRLGKSGKLYLLNAVRLDYKTRKLAEKARGLGLPREDHLEFLPIVDLWVLAENLKITIPFLEPFNLPLDSPIRDENDAREGARCASGNSLPYCWDLKETTLQHVEGDRVSAEPTASSPVSPHRLNICHLMAFDTQQPQHLQPGPHGLQEPGQQQCLQLQNLQQLLQQLLLQQQPSASTNIWKKKHSDWEPQELTPPSIPTKQIENQPGCEQLEGQHSTLQKRHSLLHGQQPVSDYLRSVHVQSAASFAPQPQAQQNFFQPQPSPHCQQPPPQNPLALEQFRFRLQSQQPHPQQKTSAQELQETRQNELDELPVFPQTAHEELQKENAEACQRTEQYSKNPEPLCLLEFKNAHQQRSLYYSSLIFEPLDHPQLIQRQLEDDDEILRQSLSLDNELFREEKSATELSPPPMPTLPWILNKSPCVPFEMPSCMSTPAISARPDWESFQANVDERHLGLMGLPEEAALRPSGPVDQSAGLHTACTSPVTALSPGAASSMCSLFSQISSVHTAKRHFVASAPETGGADLDGSTIGQVVFNNRAAAPAAAAVPATAFAPCSSNWSEFVRPLSGGNTKDESSKEARPWALQKRRGVEPRLFGTDSAWHFAH